MNSANKLRIFSGRGHPQLATRIAVCLDEMSQFESTLGNITISDFPDGEISVRIEDDVRGSDIFLVQPTCHPVNQNLMELMIMLDAFRRASASRITVVLPYYGYARQDRKDVGRVPITAKLVADLLTTAGADRVLALDLHAAQIQGFFNIPLDHLYAFRVIDDYVRSLNIPEDSLVSVSPDEGSIKRALTHQKEIGGGIAIVDKRRASAYDTKQANLIGPSLEGKTAILFDDMISTAGSIRGAAEVVKKHGAKEVYCCATHAVFCGNAKEELTKADFKEIIVTDSIPIPEEKRLPNLKVLSIAQLLADAIERIHHNRSISALFRQ